MQSTQILQRQQQYQPMVNTAPKAVVPSAALVLACLFSLGIAQAQQANDKQPAGYPNKPIRLVLGFPPGGGSDTTSRFVARRLSDKVGASIVVENKPGAGGVIAMQAAAGAAPDGYTLFFGGTQVATAMVKQQLAGEIIIDVRKEFLPIVQITTQPYVLVINAGVPANTVKEFIAYAKVRPDQLNHSSSGNGSGGHVMSEYLKSLAGIKMTHIPYKGTALAAVDLASGRVQMTITNVLSAKNNMKTGKTKALAVTSSRRSPYLDLPTLAEAGVSGFDVSSWYGLYFPSNTPQSMVQMINREATAVVNSPEVKEELARDGSEAVGPNTPTEFRNYFLKEIDKWELYVKSTGITLTE